MALAEVDGFLIPRSDAHQGEYVAPRDERLAWLTGFTGSAGACVVLADRAALFVDGRYTLQSRSQTDPGVFSYRALPGEPLSDYIAEEAQEGAIIGYDAWLHTPKEISALEARLAAKGISLRALEENPLDTAWADQPPPPAGKAAPYPIEFAGVSHEEKRARIAGELKSRGIDAFVLTLPDSISWLLNMRGADIPRIPVVLAFAIITSDGAVSLFADPAKFGSEARAHLGPDVSIAPPEAFAGALAGLRGRIGLDPASCPIRVQHALSGADIAPLRDPCILPKACKTEAELEGARAAQLADAAAMARFLAWLDEAAPQGGLTEIDVAKRLEEERRSANTLRDISFETISGAGPNGAIVHYRVSEESNREISPGDLLLVDSGGQYLSGTTDITRTIATGPAAPEAREAFTLVLKGMIAISRARWPEGLAGRDLDALARIALWQNGMDYDHGTGHGVGAFLSVHEGPQNLSRRGVEPLRAGMILSNEPGYYLEGSFGIRIENLVAVTAPEAAGTGPRKMMSFETLTFTPIDRRLINTDLLNSDELAWLNAYHASTYAIVSPVVEGSTRSWLEQACAPLGS